MSFFLRLWTDVITWPVLFVALFVDGILLWPGCHFFVCASLSSSHHFTKATTNACVIYVSCLREIRAAYTFYALLLGYDDNNKLSILIIWFRWILSCIPTVCVCYLALYEASDTGQYWPSQQQNNIEITQRSNRLSG